MSWETDWVREYPCPCGKGTYEVESRSDDWGRSETNYTMLCKECKDIYYYSNEKVHGHPGNYVAKGWTLKDK